MTDTETDIQQDPAEEAEWLKQLRKDAEEAKKLRKEVAGLRRGSAMDELGIPRTGAGKLFREKWDGDPDDRDGLLAAAKEYELIPQEDKPDDSEVAQALDAASGMADIASAGSSATPTVDTLLAEATSIDDIERIAQDAGVGVPIR